MSAPINRKTKTALDRIVRDGLSAALMSAEPKSAALNAKTIATVSRFLVAHLIVDDRFIDCMSAIVPEKTKELLTTEDAARLSGFSRPLIIALLDGDHYPGTVVRTPKGHRRVERGEFLEWLRTVSEPKGLPKTIEDVRSGPRDEESAIEALSKSETKARQGEKAERMELARSMGMF